MNNLSVPGNPESVRLLEHFLALARQGMVGHVSLVACIREPADVFGGMAGDVLLESMSVEAVKGVLLKNLEQSIENRTPPPADPSFAADHVRYNVSRAPLSFDFINWLIDAEMTRIREGAPAPLKVGFWEGRDASSGLQSPSRRQMFDNVVRPALALIGAREIDPTIPGRCVENYVQTEIFAAAAKGETVPKLRAPAEIAAHIAKQFRDGEFVTITLRECSASWPHRNSNVEAWTRFADDLRAAGERVIFVRDTEKAFDPLDGHETYPQASLRLDWRMALYERAKINLFVANGPCALAEYSDRPYMIFLDVKPDGHPFFPSTPKFIRQYMGLEVGEQHSWALPDQRIVWTKDDYPNITDAWERFMGAKAAAA